MLVDRTEKDDGVAKSEYWYPGDTHPVSADQLKEAGPEFQKEVMKEWFLSRFENPVHSTPYDEGYIYIWGGPYDASQELEEEFGEIIKHAVIHECAAELEEQEGCEEWAGKPTQDDYEESLFKAVGQNSDFFRTFLDSISSIEMLLNYDWDERLSQVLYRLLFVNAISTLETYLADAFMNTVLPSETSLRNFVERNPDFRKRTLTLDKIFGRMEALRDEVRAYLLDIRYHNLAKVGEMYKTTLDVRFPPDSGNLFCAINQRHDLVHRNGKSKDGDTIILKRENVVDLIQEVRLSVGFINDQLIARADH